MVATILRSASHEAVWWHRRMRRVGGYPVPVRRAGNPHRVQCVANPVEHRKGDCAMIGTLAWWLDKPHRPTTDGPFARATTHYLLDDRDRAQLARWAAGAIRRTAHLMMMPDGIDPRTWYPERARRAERHLGIPYIRAVVAVGDDGHFVRG